MALPRLTRRSVRRALQRHRRLAAGACLALAVMTGLSAVRPPPPPTTPLVVAARDVPAGTLLTPEDLTTRAVPPDAVPDGAAAAPDDAYGRVLAVPMRTGEAVTDVRLVGPGLLQGYGSGTVAAPVRVADPGAVALVRPGDRVDVLAVPVDAATDPSGGRIVARASPVVAVPAPDEVGSAVEGALVILAVPSSTAIDLAEAAVRARLSLVLRPGPRDPV